MKKKIFFVLSSFRAGGAERVFWLLSQSFDKDSFDVNLILLSTGDSFYTTQLEGVRVIDLQTVKASRSFFKLYSLLRTEKPDVVFCTGGQINLLVGMISVLLRGTKLIARPTNQDNSKFLSLKAKALGIFFAKIYKRFDVIVCQSGEIRAHVLAKHGISPSKIRVIPNPVVINKVVRPEIVENELKKLIVVARLTQQKGISRLLDIFSRLPVNYRLTIVGDGILKNEIEEKILALDLYERVKMLGMINNVIEVVSTHDLFVLPSYIEGFPNVVVESLSVGTPVVSFQVGGISDIIVPGFNGFIVQQNDLDSFEKQILEASEKRWDTDAIRSDIFNRFSLEKVTGYYEALTS